MKKAPAVKKVTVKKRMSTSSIFILEQPKENPWARRIAERNIQIPAVESLRIKHCIILLRR